MADPHTLPREELIPWPELNARKIFHREPLAELAESIKDVGIGQPLGVTLQPKPPHWIFAGERRWRAAEGILEELPVHIRHLTTEQAIKLNLTENIQRNDLTPMEEAHGLERYMETSGKSQVDVAKEIGKTQGWVSNRIRLLRLPEPLQELFDKEAFTHSQARDLILPFASLEEDQWRHLAIAATSQLAKKFKKVKRPLVEEEIREIVSKIAVAMSGWLDYYVWSEDTGDLFPSYLVVPPADWKKAPKGSLVQYSYGDHGRKSTRVFDMEWWEEAMGVVRLRRKEEEEARAAESKGDLEGDDSDLDWSPELGKIPSTTTVPFQKRHLVFQPTNQEKGEHYDLRDSLGGSGTPRKGNLFCDPTLIPKECLVFQEGVPNTTQQYYAPAILCTRKDVYDSAVEGLKAKMEDLTDRRLGREVKKDIDGSKSINLSDCLSSLLAFGFTVGQADFIQEAAEDLGISPG